LTVWTACKTSIEKEKINIKNSGCSSGKDESKKHLRIDSSYKVIIFYFLAIEKGDSAGIELSKCKYNITGAGSNCKRLIWHLIVKYALIDLLEHCHHILAYIIVCIVNISEINVVWIVC
jgi:hypothetical protein